MKTVNPNDLTPADYNPRKMDDPSKEALKHSMTEFDDISGITWNKTTGNIVTGHHRWEALCEEHGKDNLIFNHLKGDRFSIETKDNKDTNYTLRVVEWDAKKEKAANITANSQLTAGQFTADLTTLLDGLKIDMEGTIFNDLRFDELLTFEERNALNTGVYDDGDWDSDLVETTSPHEDSDLNKDLGVRVTVSCLFQDKKKVLDALTQALEGMENVKISG